MSRPNHFEDAGNFRDFSNVLANQAIDALALAYLIPDEAKYVLYRERLLAVSNELRRIHGGLLAVSNQAV